MKDDDGNACGHSAGDLQVDNSILIKNYHSGSLGITLQKDALAPAQTIRMTDLSAGEKILNSGSLFKNWHLGNEEDTDGSYQLVYENESKPGVYLYDEDGAVAPGYHLALDVNGAPFYASAVREQYTTYASEHVIGSNSDDLVIGVGGLGDIIETGKGHDRVYEGRGDDVISGGADRDILYGGDASNDARYEGERRVA